MGVRAPACVLVPANDSVGSRERLSLTWTVRVCVGDSQSSDGHKLTSVWNFEVSAPALQERYTYVVVVRTLRTRRELIFGVFVDLESWPSTPRLGFESLGLIGRTYTVPQDFPLELRSVCFTSRDEMKKVM